MIICAAIKIEHADNEGNLLEPIIICGYRHGYIYKNFKYLDINRINDIQGFITHEGEFLNREEAYSHAYNCGQLNIHNQWYRKDNDLSNELYSEDLY